MPGITEELLASATSGITRGREEELRRMLSRRVSHLSLQEKRLSSLDGLALCTAVKVVYAYGNRIAALGQALEGLEQLSMLYLEHNRLADLEGIGAVFSTLRALFVDHNALQSLSGDGLAGCRQLEELHAANQRLAPGTSLRFDPVVIRSLAPSLRVLDVSGCGLTDDSLADLLPLRRLTSLAIANNRVASLEAACGLVAGMPGLETLDVRGNPFTAGAGKYAYRGPLIHAAASRGSDALQRLDGQDVEPRYRRWVEALAARRAADGSGGSLRGGPSVYSSQGGGGGGGGGGGVGGGDPLGLPFPPSQSGGSRGGAGSRRGLPAPLRSKLAPLSTAMRAGAGGPNHQEGAAGSGHASWSSSADPADAGGFPQSQWGGTAAQFEIQPASAPHSPPANAARVRTAANPQEGAGEEAAAGVSVVAAPELPGSVADGAEQPASGGEGGPSAAAAEAPAAAGASSSSSSSSLSPSPSDEGVGPDEDDEVRVGADSRVKESDGAEGGAGATGGASGPDGATDRGSDETLAAALLGDTLPKFPSRGGDGAGLLHHAGALSTVAESSVEETMLLDGAGDSGGSGEMGEGQGEGGEAVVAAAVAAPKPPRHSKAADSGMDAAGELFAAHRAREAALAASAVGDESGFTSRRPVVLGYYTQEAHAPVRTPSDFARSSRFRDSGYCPPDAIVRVEREVAARLLTRARDAVIGGATTVSVAGGGLAGGSSRSTTTTLSSTGGRLSPMPSVAGSGGGMAGPVAAAAAAHLAVSTLGFAFPPEASSRRGSGGSLGETSSVGSVITLDSGYGHNQRANAAPRATLPAVQLRGTRNGTVGGGGGGGLHTLSAASLAVAANAVNDYTIGGSLARYILADEARRPALQPRHAPVTIIPSPPPKGPAPPGGRRVSPSRVLGTSPWS
jgi:hypothetical protein